MNGKLTLVFIEYVIIIRKISSIKMNIKKGKYMQNSTNVHLEIKEPYYCSTNQRRKVTHIRNGIHVSDVYTYQQNKPDLYLDNKFVLQLLYAAAFMLDSNRNQLRLGFMQRNDIAIFSALATEIPHCLILQESDQKMTLQEFITTKSRLISYCINDAHLFDLQSAIEVGNKVSANVY
eukprot:229571_1